MPKPEPKDENWYQKRIDHLVAHSEAVTQALIQMNANLVQLAARIVETSRNNEAQLLLGMVPLLKEDRDDPKVLATLQGIAETLRKEEKKPDE